MRAITLLLLLLPIVFSPVNAAGDKFHDYPWTQFFGSHYDDAVWAESTRDPLSPAIAGYWPDVEKRHPDLDKRFAELLRDLEKRLLHKDVVLGVGGLGSGRRLEDVNAFMDMVSQDNGKRWKKELYSRVSKVARIEHSRDRVYWQFGNEINGPRFLRNMVEWGGGDMRQPRTAMAQYIPLYVEYFLAPGIEAIRDASRDVYGEEGQIRIMLGSLANARHPRSIDWYKQLLDYEIQGRYAPTLRGRRVYDLVDTLSIHYLLTAPDDYWADALDDLSRSYMGRGAVRRIWSTEEVGIRRASSGYGAATALQVWARALSWWQKYEWKPQHGRVFFWGWNQGNKDTRVDDSMMTIYNFTGKRSVSFMDRVKGDVHPGDLESYVFLVTGRPDKRLLVIVPRGRESSATLKQLVIPAGKARGPVVAKVHLFTPEGQKQYTANTVVRGNSEIIELNRAINLQSGSALLVLLGK